MKRYVVEQISENPEVWVVSVWDNMSNSYDYSHSPHFYNREEAESYALELNKENEER